MTPAFQPIALSPRDAATYLAVSRRTLSDLIRKGKVAARKAGTRTLVDTASLQSYYESLPPKVGASPIIFGERAHVRPKSRPRKKTQH
jgi:excisionase family DNA binding protein